jgi:hypothetical protein
MCWKLRNERYKNCPGYCKALFGYEGETMEEHPCHHCNKDRTCGGTCPKFRMWMALLAGKAAIAVNKAAAESAEAIKARRPSEP